ncbi:hypothetical protein Tco_1146091 [Tanacetum coccineum]
MLMVILKSPSINFEIKLGSSVSCPNHAIFWHLIKRPTSSHPLFQQDPSTLKIPKVPITVGEAYAFPVFLEGAARIVSNPKEDLKGSLPKWCYQSKGTKPVNHDTEMTKDTMPPANNGSTEDVQPPIVQIQSRNPNPELNVAPVVTPVPKASIPFPSQRNDEKRKEKANDQIEKFYEIFRDLSFEFSLPMP